MGCYVDNDLANLDHDRDDPKPAGGTL
jgi:hypothetical protein